MDRPRYHKLNVLLTSALCVVGSAAISRAADYSWSGTTGTYNNAAAWGGTVPGVLDHAINDNGSGNVVQINIGDPDWIVNQIYAGNSLGNGAFTQNGQTVYITNNVGRGAVRLGVAAGLSGSYTINGGALNYTGDFNVGELGTGTLNVNGGLIAGSGNLAVNVGSSLNGVTSTMGGTNKSDYTWFEQNFYGPNPALGIPPAGSTFASESLPDHSFTMASSYAANNAVQVFAGITNATITFTSPTAATALSLLGSAGFGTANVNYTVHHADATVETGSLPVLDWFDNNGTVAVRSGGRISANGLDVQIITDGPNKPYIFTFDLTLTNTTSAVTSIDLKYVSGGVASILAVSSSTGAAFTPKAITGYNQDIVMEAGAPIYPANSVTDTLTQTNGSINITGELWVGNYGNGVFNFSGGTNSFQNWTALGRAGGHGILNMTGGVINKTGNGNFLIGTGYQAPAGSTPSGVINQSAGTINSTGEFSIPENSPAIGTYNLSGTGVLTVNNWMQVGRSGGTGVMTMSGGSVTKTGGGNFIIGDNASGTLTQTGGSIDIQSGESWIGQGGSAVGTYNLSGGTFICENNWISLGRNGGNGTLNLTNGVFSKAGGGNFSIGGDGGATGALNQYGGTVSNAANASSYTWLGQGGGNGTWTMNGGSAVLGTLQFCEGGNGSGILYLNGGLVSASEVNCGLDGANAALYFNGGTLQARGNNDNFLHGLGAAYVMAGGAVIDSQSYNIGVSQVLGDGGGGGLTKIGNGTLTLSGANYYTGPTVVNGGTLVIKTDTTANGDYSVASGAQLGVGVLGMNAQVNVANLTLAGASSALGFDVGAFGNPTTAPLNVTGNLAVNGTVAINLTDSLPQLGQIPVVQYGTRSGSGNFVLGTAPIGVVADILTNGNTIVVNISQVSVPRWEGLDGGTWDIGLTTNWINAGTGIPTTFGQGNAVTFDDNALGTTTVNVTTTVNPASVLFNNSTLPYTLNGTGKISGNTGLTKQGTGAVTIANTGGNDYVGATVIANGTLNVTSLANGGAPSAIGASTASPNNLVLGNGALSYSGPATSINRGYTVQGTNAAIDVQANLALSGSVAVQGATAFTKTGPAQLAYIGGGSNVLSSGGYAIRAGTVVFDGTAAGQTNLVQGTFSVAGATSAAANVTNVTLTVNDNAVGNVAGSFGTMTVNSNTVLNVNSWLTLGDAADSVSSLTLNGGTINVPNGRLFLCSAPGTTATLNINNGVINKNSGDIICIADGGWNGSGARTGVVNQVGGTVNISPEIQIGQVDGGTGIYNFHGGAINSTGWFVIGRAGGNGTFNMDGGVLTHTSGGQPAFIVSSGAGNNNVASVGVLNHSAGTINCPSEYWVAENSLVSGTNNISGTAVVNAGNWVSLGRGGHGTINMSGGTFNKTGGGNFIVGEGGGTCLWNQTGGALNINSQLWIGQAPNTTSEFDLSAGTVTNNSWLAVGREDGHGTLNISGGTMVKAGNGNISIAHGIGDSTVIPEGTVNQTGGTFICASGETWIGEDSGPGIWNISGGTASFGYVQLARNASATGTLNLNGGVVAANEITTGSSGTSTLNLNGGTLAAQISNTNFLHGLTTATVMSGVTIDSRTNVVSISQPLLDGGTGGGLTKIGNGIVYLNGVNTYTGATLVNAGALGGSGTIAGPVSVASGAGLAPGDGIGTLTINNTLTLAAGSSTFVNVSLDGGVTNSDLVTGLTGLTYGGTLVVTNAGTSPLVVGAKFKLFNTAVAAGGNFSSVTILPAGAGTFNPATGELTITASGVAPTVNPPVVSGGSLILTGTGGTPGGSYSWLTSTNVATPISGWTTNVSGVFDVNGAFSNAIPVSVSEPSRFFRLKTP